MTAPINATCKHSCQATWQSVQSIVFCPLRLHPSHRGQQGLSLHTEAACLNLLVSLSRTPFCLFSGECLPPVKKPVSSSAYATPAPPATGAFSLHPQRLYHTSMSPSHVIFTFIFNFDKIHNIKFTILTIFIVIPVALNTFTLLCNKSPQRFHLTKLEL